jgi:hypothetical protein
LTTSAELAAAAERAEAAGRAAGERLVELTRRRSEALLNDDEAGLDKIEAELTRTQRDADRADLAAAELRRRHGEALTAERQAERDALVARAEEVQRRGLELVQKQYPRLAAPLVKLASQLWELEGEIEVLNEALRKAGDDRQVLSVERARRGPDPGQGVFLDCQFLIDFCLPSADGSRDYLVAPPGHFRSLAGVLPSGGPRVSPYAAPLGQRSSPLGPATFG